MNAMPIHIPPFLVDQIKGNDAIAFVGSGLSRHAGGPTWTELLRSVVDANRDLVHDGDRPQLRSAETALSEGRLINAATVIGAIPGIDLRTDLANAVRRWPFRLTASDAHENLLRLN